MKNHIDESNINNLIDFLSIGEFNLINNSFSIIKKKILNHLLFEKKLIDGLIQNFSKIIDLPYLENNILIEKNRIQLDIQNFFNLTHKFDTGQGIIENSGKLYLLYFFYLKSKDPITLIEIFKATLNQN